MRLFFNGLLQFSLLAFVSLFVTRPFTKANSEARPDLPYRLRFFHTHTGERLDTVYRHGDTYDSSALSTLNHYLRDHRTNDIHSYDPVVFDLLHDLVVALGRPDAEIDVICGYRTPWSNEYLRSHGHGVAEHSLHMQAMALDIRIPGVTADRASQCCFVAAPLGGSVATSVALSNASVRAASSDQTGFERISVLRMLQSLNRVCLRVLASLLGLGLLGYFVLRAGPALVWKQGHEAGWGLGLIDYLLGGLSQLHRTCAWRQTFMCDIRGLSWARSFAAQLAADAAGQLGVLGS